MNDSKLTYVGVGFLALCLTIAGGVYFLDKHLRDLRRQYDNLERKRATLEQDRDSLREQITIFKNAFLSLEDYNVQAAANDMDFYGQVQQKVQENSDVDIITQRQNGVRDGRSSISLTLRGDYYSFMKILAGWRNLPISVSVSQFSMTAPRDSQVLGEIQADVVVEAIIATVSTPSGR